MTLPPTGPESQPRLSPGHAPRDAFEHMDAQQIAAWLKDAFCADDRPKNAVDAAVGPPIVWVSTGFPRFSDAIKQRFTTAILTLLDDISNRPDGWDTPVLRRMAAFTETVSTAAPTADRTQLQKKFLQLLDNDAFSADQKTTFLLGLLGTRYRATPQALDSLQQQGSNQASTTKIVFSIAAQDDLPGAMHWLAKQPQEHVSETLLDITPWLMFIHGEDAVRTVYASQNFDFTWWEKVISRAPNPKGGPSRA